MAHNEHNSQELPKDIVTINPSTYALPVYLDKNSILKQDEIKNNFAIKQQPLALLIYRQSSTSTNRKTDVAEENEDKPEPLRILRRNSYNNDEGLSNEFGLLCLRSIDKIFINQTVELLEVFSNWESSNRYVMKNSAGKEIMFAIEDSDICVRQCCGHQRSFVIHIYNSLNIEIARAIRKFRFGTSFASCHLCCCCFLCGPCENDTTEHSPFPNSFNTNRKAVKRCNCAKPFMQSLIFEAPPGELLGIIRQEPNIVLPEWSIFDADDRKVVKLYGPDVCCKLPCFVDNSIFQIMSADGGTLLGHVKKEWSGIAQELFTDADDFSITFPEDLNVSVKALLLGAVFLIDFTYFENNRGQSS